MKKIKLIYNSGAGQSKFKYFLDTILEKFMENDCDSTEIIQKMRVFG